MSNTHRITSRTRRVKCQRCERAAHYVDVRPYIIDYHGTGLAVHILCFKCGQSDPENGYWFEITRWFGGPKDLRDSTREYTIRDHIIDTKRDGYDAVELIDLAIAAQTTWGQLRSRNSTSTPTPKRSVSQRKRFAILQRDDFRCQLCGRNAEKDGVTLHVDHQQPVSKGGSNEDENLWTLCSDCNGGKGARLS